MSPVLIRRVRLAAAFVLLTYLILHFSNHALGLISLDAMETGRRWFLAIWRNPLGTLALYGAITVHGVLALWLLYQRRSLRMPSWEAAQYGLGLVLPALLATHVVGTRIAWWQVGTEDRYARVLLGFWVVAPERGIWQTITLLIAWIHACIGVHYWLRFRRWYPRVVMALFAGALLLPTLALAGYVTGGHEVVTLARTPGWREELARVTHPPSPAQGAVLVQIRTRFLEVYLAALLAVVVARGARRLWQRRRSIRVSYPGDRFVTVPVGFTILEASRAAAIPHASVCGGRGRCSTCRVRVVHGLGDLPAAREAEQRVLARVGAAPDVRLACQTRPVRDVAVAPLLAPSITPGDSHTADVRQGRERELAVLFADLRGFTRMAEHKLPYDVVFVLNRYFETVGTAITQAGGVTNQFTGDGVMALFGIDVGPAAGCRQRSPPRARWSKAWPRSAPSWPAIFRRRYASGSASTPARPSSAGWAGARASISRPSATPSTWPRGWSRPPRTTTPSSSSRKTSVATRGSTCPRFVATIWPSGTARGVCWCA